MNFTRLMKFAVFGFLIFTTIPGYFANAQEDEPKVNNINWEWVKKPYTRTLIYFGSEDDRCWEIANQVQSWLVRIDLMRITDRYEVIDASIWVSGWDSESEGLMVFNYNALHTGFIPKAECNNLIDVMDKAIDVFKKGL